MTNSKCKYYLFCLSVFLISVVCMGMSVFASGSDVSYFQKDNSSLQITVFAPMGEYVTVNILYEGKFLEELTPYNVKETHVYQNQMRADESGKAVFDVGLVKGGNYNLYYKIGQDSVKSTVVSIVNFDEQVEILDSIVFSDVSESEKLAAINRFYTEPAIISALNISKGEFDNIDDETVHVYVLRCFEENGTNEDSVARARKAFNSGVLLAAVNEGAIDNVFEADEFVDFDNSPVSDWYNKNCVSESIKKSVTSDIISVSPQTLAEFMTVLTEKLILAVVYEPDGVLNAKEIMDDFCDLIGIEPSESVADYRKVAQKKYNSLDELKAAFEKKDSDFGSSSGSGGGGGGGASKGGSLRVDPVVVAQPTPEKLPEMIYNDLDTASWASEYIVYLSEKNIVGGKGNGIFAPNDNITREEFTKMIILAFAPESEPEKISFSDVSEKDWYYDYVSKAYSKGIITGYDNGSFGVGENITREDMAVIAFRASGKKANGDEIRFDDSDLISDYAVEAVTELSNLGVIAGNGDSFMPKSPATRAQAAKIICLLMQM